MAISSEAQELKGLVDMGSNGIRFSISNMSSSTARIMPTLYQDRCGVSLYDAQYQTGSKMPIPENAIDEVIAALSRFKKTCLDFQVVDVRIVATEATRNASNSSEFRRLIENETGWKVEMLAKEEEGRVGAMGVASSFSNIKGLVMDLGGGSVQLTWMISDKGNIDTCQQGAVSLPYGAAALKRLLAEAEDKGNSAVEKLQIRMIEQFKQAVKDIQVPPALLQASQNGNGLPLYLSGGGFRGWGYVLMSSDLVQPYPIPIINGFTVTTSSFSPTSNQIQSTIDNSLFRISSRRASQIPAVSFLVTALLAALPAISSVQFAQGGLREGLLFSSLPLSLRSQHPLVTATSRFAPLSLSSEALTTLLQCAIPKKLQNAAIDLPSFLYDISFLTSMVYLMNAHASVPKDIRAATALRSTTTGILADSHGLAHLDRALLGLILCERWEGELSLIDVEFMVKMQELVGDKQAWLAKYVGIVLRGVGETYPAGIVRPNEKSLNFSATWETIEKGGTALGMSISLPESRGTQTAPAWVVDLEKLGKRKNWIGGRDGWGLKVETVVRWY
ncbi:hypothetical protein MMC14_006324 [Varicellaria rhodocarpa]|nr:hypothetical protein [Varicellaria rhodocarpa]